MGVTVFRVQRGPARQSALSTQSAFRMDDMPSSPLICANLRNLWMRKDHLDAPADACLSHVS